MVFKTINDIKDQRKLSFHIISVFIIIVSVITSITCGIGVFLVRIDSRRNIYSTLKYDCTTTSMFIENMLSNTEAMGEAFSIDEDLRVFLANESSMTTSKRIACAYQVNQKLKKNLFLHNYFHSFCIVTNSENTYFSNDIGPSFLPFFINNALDGNLLDEYKNNNYFTKIYEYPASSANKATITMISYVCCINQIIDGHVSLLGRIIININLDQIINSLIGYDSFASGLCNIDGSNIKYIENPVLEDKIQSIISDQNNNGVLDQQYIYISDEILHSGLRLILIRDVSDMQSYINRQYVVIYFLMVVIIIALIALILWPTLKKITIQINKLSSAMDDVSDGDLSKKLGLHGSLEMVNISTVFNHMASQIREKTKSLLDEQRKEQELSFVLLLARINPHFIYNTLNSVIYLARRGKDDDIILLTKSFISLLQDSIHLNENKIWATVGEETDVIDKYIVVQKYRYGERFKYEKKVDSSINNEIIPKGIISPLIENSILHGICESDQPGTIRLEIAKKDEDILITVSDTGVGMDSKTLESIRGHKNIAPDNNRGMHSIGLYNVWDRLEFLYKSNYKMDIQSNVNKGTIIRILLPHHCAERKDLTINLCSNCSES